jgi:bifunctional non-homologous end joining protein LigD
MQLPPTPDGTVEVDGRHVELTNLDRPLADAFRKRDLISYYARVAPVLVPHLTGRPLSLVRFPAGLSGRGFLQNECRGAPPWMHTASLRLRTGATRRYCLVDDVASLLWVANLGTLELHPYLATHARPDHPVQVILDLDTGPGLGLLDAARVALALRDRLLALGLTTVVKNSGVSGLHVAVPVGDATFPQVRDFARRLAVMLAADDPLGVASADAASRRAGRVLVDWRQNDPRRSTAAPYSLRATEPLGVSAPVRWSEVEAALAAGDATRLRPSPAEVVERIAAEGDLFMSPAQDLPGTERWRA